MSNAILVAALSTDPFQSVVDGVEFLEVRGQTPGQDGFEVILRTKATKDGPSDLLRNQKEEDNLIIAGELALVGKKGDPDEGKPIIFVSSVCVATDDQYFNEATLVGRFAKESKQAEKSSSRTVIVNRYRKKPDNSFEQIPDYFRIRGFGTHKDKIDSSSKGALVEATGVLTSQTNKEGKTYTELKVRRIRSHEKGSGGYKKSDPSEGKAASGYDHKHFMGSDEDSIPTNW